MSETIEKFQGERNDTESSQNQSIFYDRYDGPFLRWLGAQGLALDASDQEIMQVMEEHLQKNNSASISI